MSVICPTVTAYDSHQYREQVERVANFAERLHLDYMDGNFVGTRSPDLIQFWWPENTVADLHLMCQRPAAQVEVITKLRPSLVVVHAEADGFNDFVNELQKLKGLGIRVGIALLQDTSVAQLKEVLPQFDHLLIFSGNLGHQGGSQVNLGLLDKLKTAKAINPELEIGWDGGIDDQVAAELIVGGVDVLNSGGFTQNADDPAAAYAKLKLIADQQK